MATRGKLVWRWVGLLFGLALAAWAMVLASRQIDLAVFTVANLSTLAAMAALVLGSLLLTAGLFWVITLSFDTTPRVSLLRMTQLIGASALINYLPLGWPGPVARSAYLKVRHAMPVRQSVLVLLIVMALSAALTLLVVGVAALGSRVMQVMFAGVGLVLLSALSGPLAQRLLRRRFHAAWTWAPLKAADMLLSAARLSLAFALLGHPVTLPQALVFAALDTLVSMAAITPSGLGLSEWAIGLASQVMGAAASPVGAAAKLVERSVNVAVVIVVGLLSIRALPRR
ncbi:MAG: hypothetical protein WD042_18655 [Phycisphaeraceae bacterium]